MVVLRPLVGYKAVQPRTPHQLAHMNLPVAPAKELSAVINKPIFVLNIDGRSPLFGVAQNLQPIIGFEVIEILRVLYGNSFGLQFCVYLI